MDTISALLEFIERARSERKYAESTARGYTAAVKLFAGYVSDDERADDGKLLQNIDNIAADIYAKQADENITVTTLVVYKRRMRKLIEDHREFGGSPEKLAGWNPRRPARELRPKEPKPAEQLPAVLLKPARAATSQLAGVRPSDTDDGSEPPAIMNRSEISLRHNLRIALELPVDLTKPEADKIKQLIDIMLPPG